jgi:hypothetical protein
MAQRVSIDHVLGITQSREDICMVDVFPFGDQIPKMLNVTYGTFTIHIEVEPAFDGKGVKFREFIKIQSNGRHSGSLATEGALTAMPTINRPGVEN